MRPMEAYESVMRFAAERGEPALRLAFHAAVPQSFRPDLLHLLRLNFVPNAPFEAESDVLLAPFCEDAGGGYYQFDPEVRRLLLDNLDPTYPEEQGHRVRRVADFLATYIESRSRSLNEDQDRLSRDFLSIQGWIALAFRDPEVAAVQLAAALDQGTREDLAARIQFSGLASALSVPLVQYPKLLTYAAGLEALEQGRTYDAADLLERLPDEEIQIGGVRLRSPRRFIVRSSTPIEIEEPVPQASYKKCFIGYAEGDREFVDRLRVALRMSGVPIWFAPEELKAGANLESSIREALLSSDVLLLVLSLSSFRSRWIQFEAEAALRHSIPIIPLDLGGWQRERPGWLSMVLDRFLMINFVGWEENLNVYSALDTLLDSLRTDAAPAEEAVAETIPEVSKDSANAGWEVLRRAGFEYHCYISWDDSSSEADRRLVKRFVKILTQSLVDHFGLPKIFFREKTPWYGRFFDADRDTALYRSAAMVALYTPGYAEPKARGGREWAAMEQLGRARIPGEPFGLIIPLVLPGTTLPTQFRHVQFVSVTSVDHFLSAPKEVAQRIEDIVAALVRHGARVEPRRFELPERSAFDQESRQETDKGYVYFCFSREDRRIVEKIVHEFKVASIPVWFDRSLPIVDEYWREGIGQAIEHSSLFLFIVSPDSLNSKIVSWELDYAREISSRKPLDRPFIIPVVLGDLPRERLPSFLQRIQEFRLQDKGSLPHLVSYIVKFLERTHRDDPWR